jgi:hypothetical protein
VTGVSVILTFAAETHRRKETEARGLWLYLIVPLWLPGLWLLFFFAVNYMRAVFMVVNVV